MGVTINHRLGQTKPNVKGTLDQAEAVAVAIQKQSDVRVEIRRPDAMTLMVDVEGCETLAFAFKSVKEIMDGAKDGFSYDHAVLTDDGSKKLDEGYEIAEYPQNEKYYCAHSCKTQFAGNIMAHKIVADLIKVVASRCRSAEVHDEGDYYHSGKLGDAVRSIRENGALIDGLNGKLGELGYEIVRGGETRIGSDY